jgi:hypothetical protein
MIEHEQVRAIFPGAKPRAMDKMNRCRDLNSSRQIRRQIKIDRGRLIIRAR